MQKRGNHRRTRSTLPEELNKILLTTDSQSGDPEGGGVVGAVSGGSFIGIGGAGAAYN